MATEKTEPTTKKIICPVCAKTNARFNDKVGMYICPDCGHEWIDDIQKDIPLSEIGPGD